MAEFTVTLTADDLALWLQTAGVELPEHTEAELAEAFSEAEDDERIRADVYSAVSETVFSRVVKWLQ